MMQNDLREEHRAQRGESLVEVLTALAILLLILVSILQMFSLSLLSFHATSAHRDMMRKAQEVVEIYRMVASTRISGTSGILPLAVGTRHLPESSSDSGYDFWGPSSFNIVQEGAPYRVNINIADGVTEWLVTVFVDPAPRSSNGKIYLGPVSRKGVRYATRIPK